MISVSGLPDDSLDEGMDALDFGLTQHSARRGLLVTRGLGFFRAGIVDQHFSQFRGRLGRLARVTIDRKLRFGFGVDEDTAMIVSPGGIIEVAGSGNVTIVDAREARCDDGPLGCRITGVTLSMLGRGRPLRPHIGRCRSGSWQNADRGRDRNEQRQFPDSGHRGRGRLVVGLGAGAGR